MSEDGGKYVQPSLEELGTPLSHVTFTVVDLETTGFASDAASITEIGAVKVRGGEVLGEFATLVNPHEPIEPRISTLTGITNEMVANAPSITTVLPAFLEFAAGTTWVAHNAPFDVGFLRAACMKGQYHWPRPQVIDTVTLARRLIDRSEVPNRRLSTLARYFGATVTPTHRALDDARATVDILHALLERLGPHHVITDVDLAEFQRAIPTTEQRRKRHLAKGLPHSPGVYIFRDNEDRPLYIGTSRDIATRVRNYFTGGEKRSRMRQMLNLAERVEAIECAHQLEANIRELRMIGHVKPPYNARSKNPERLSWLRMTAEPFPRLSIARKPPELGADWLGPFTSGKLAQLVMEAVTEAIPVRRCTTRLSATAKSPDCAMAELGCPAPCQHRISINDYKDITDSFGHSIADNPDDIVDRLLNRISELSNRQRFESAAALRSQLRAFLQSVIRTQRARSLIALPELIAANRVTNGGWEVSVIRHGILANAGTTPARVNPMPMIDSLRASATWVPPHPQTLAGTSITETELILSWLERPSVRIVDSGDGWHMPIHAAARHQKLLKQLTAIEHTESSINIIERSGHVPYRP